jgi:hypothetical protein
MGLRTSILVLLLSASAWLQAGTSKFQTEILKIGQFQNITSGSFKILSLKTSMEFYMDEIIVDLYFEIKNKGMEERVKWGLPVQFIGPQKASEMKKWEEFIFDYEISDQRGEISHYDSLSYFNGELEREQDYPIHHRWLVSSLRFGQKEVKTLHVHYHLKSHQISSQSTPGHYGLKDQLFRYSFEPLSDKAFKTVNKFSLDIDFSQLEGIGINPQFDWFYPIKRTDSLHFLFEKSSLDCEKTQEFDIHYDTSPMMMSSFFKGGKDGKYFCELVPESINASSELKEEFSIDKAFDFNFETAWAEGHEGNGKNQFIEFTLAEQGKINGLALLNGYYKNDFLYYATNRPSKINLKFINTSNGKDILISERSLFLEDLPYMDFDKDQYVEQLSILFDDKIKGIEMVDKIRLTIEEVYAGTDYHDACITEIIPIYIPPQE